MSDQKPILCLDFDGVLHAYTSGWQGVDKVIDGPVPGAMEFIARATNTFDVCILSSRSKHPDGLAAMKRALSSWLRQAGYEPSVFHKVSWPTEKPAAFITIDDRALTFTGVFPPIKELVAFVPWNKKDAGG